jgi:hypothetical protein
MKDGVGVVPDRAVMSEQGVQGGIEHDPLRGPHVEDQRGGCVVAYPYHLGAARQEVQDHFVKHFVHFSPHSIQFDLFV